MTVDEAIAVFTSSSLNEKKDFLAQLIHDLTIDARDSYEVGGSGLTNPQRVRRINEVQHRVSDFLLALMRDNPHRYPDETLVRIVLEHPSDSELEQQLNRTFTRLANQRLTVA